MAPSLCRPQWCPINAPAQPAHVQPCLPLSPFLPLSPRRSAHLHPLVPAECVPHREGARPTGGLTGRLPWVDVRASTTWAKGNLWEKDVHTHQAEEKGFQKEWGQSAGPLVPFPMQILLHSSRRFPQVAPGSEPGVRGTRLLSLALKFYGFIPQRTS